MRRLFINIMAMAGMGALLAHLGAPVTTTEFWIAMFLTGVIQLNCLISDK